MMISQPRQVPRRPLPKPPPQLPQPLQALLSRRLPQQQQPLVCTKSFYKLRLAHCLPNWAFIGTTGFCYFVAANKGMSFAIANTYCMSLTTGSFLASIHSDDEHDFAIGLFPDDNHE